MECQRCGRCCLCFVVVPVVTPEGLRAVIKSEGAKCPNISFDKQGVASCAVHHLPEFKGSACDRYGDPDVDPDFASTRGRPCKVGIYLRQFPDLIVKTYDKAPLEEDPVILGDWIEQNRLLWETSD